MLLFGVLRKLAVRILTTNSKEAPMGKILRGMFAIALFLCTASWAQAALVKYTFEDVLFNDDGTLSGPSPWTRA